MTGGRLEPPGWSHWAGTDRLGRDVFSQLMVGARIALVVGCGAVAIGAAIGVTFGVLAAFASALSRRCAGGLLRHPDRLSDPADRHAGGRGAGRGQPRHRDPGARHRPVADHRPGDAHPDQAGAVAGLHHRRADPGTSWPAIVVWHILPNIAPFLGVSLALQFGLAVMAEASLSYLGLRAPPPNASWGRLLQEAQGTVYTAPWGALLPGLALSWSSASI